MRSLRSYADAVSRPQLVVVAGLVAGSATTAGFLVFTAGGGLAEWLFGSVVLALLALVVRQGALAWHRARQEATRATALMNADPTAVARQAVREERRRLADDIGIQLRQTLVTVAEAASTARGLVDPTPVVRDIHQQARQAASELRWQLGLLREPGQTQQQPGQRQVATSHWRTRDALLGLFVAAVAVIEAIAYPRVEGFASSALSVVLTGLAGATVVAARAAPGLAALAGGSLYLAGWVFEAPLVAGFWCFAAVCGVLWIIVARADSAAVDLCGGAFLVLSAGIASWATDPENTGLLIATMVLAVVGGLVVRLARRWARAARTVVRERERELAAAAQSAVDAERGSFAREIHDVVSHAVGVIAMQAAAADVSWPTNPTAAWAAIDVIDDTARSALAGLDRLPPATPAQQRTTADLTALVNRVRAAGTPVDLTVIGEIPPALLDVVYRIVQESLTNIIRHSPGAHAQVTIRHSGEQLCVRVADTGPPAGRPRDSRPDAASTSGRGYGLIGLGERVEFVGGSLTAGVVPNAGFQVEAVLPSPTIDSMTADARPPAQVAE
jgi:signal transduction histidine kinase